MPFEDDNADACCAISACCGGDDDVKQRHAVAKLIKAQIDHPGPYTAAEVADAVLELWDLAPAGWGLKELLRKTGKMARKFPYV